MASLLLHPVIVLLIQWFTSSLVLSIRPSFFRSILTHVSLLLIYFSVNAARIHVRGVWASTFVAAYFINYLQLLSLLLVNYSPDASSFIVRLRNGFSALLDWRRILHPPTSDKIQKFRHDKIQSKRAFYISYFIWGIVTYLILDAVSSGPPPEDRTPFGPAKVAIIRAYFFGDGITLEEFLIRVFTVPVVWMNIYAMIQCITAMLFIIMVSLDLVPYETCRPVYGPFSSAYTLRDFWGTFWHQFLRFNHTTMSEYIVHDVLMVPRSWRLVSRYAKMTGVFALSGILHVLADVAGGVPLKETGTVQFFLLQGVGIMFEDAVRHLWGGSKTNNDKTAGAYKSASPPVWQRVVGYLWLAVWLIWTTPGWVFPSVVYTTGSRLPPYSFIQMKWTSG